MWQTANVLFGDSFDELDGLSPSQIGACLEKTHAYLLMNPELVKQGSVLHVQRGAGPDDRQEWLFDVSKRNYNGEGGGKFFKWYIPSIFVRELSAMGRSRNNCTE